MEGYDCVNGAGLLFVPRGAPLPPQLLPAAPAAAALLRAAPRWLGGYQLATLAAGCFWGARRRLGALPGVLWAVAGYCGGGGGAAAERPSYAQVCGGGTGHLEAVQLAYDPGAISFDEILEAFWAAHEPTSALRQGADVGPQYGCAVFYHSDAQRSAALASRAALQSALPGGAQVATGVRPAGVFFEAEAEHQAKG